MTSRKMTGSWGRWCMARTPCTLPWRVTSPRVAIAPAPPPPPSSSFSSSTASSRASPEAQTKDGAESGHAGGAPDATSPRHESPKSAVQAATESLLRGLATQRTSRELHRDVYLNPDRKSSLRHIELTHDTIRLVGLTDRMQEFAKATPEYRRHAELMFLSEEEREEQGVEEWAVPRRLKNLTFCGGGATIELDRRKVIEHLTRRRLDGGNPHEDDGGHDGNNGR